MNSHFKPAMMPLYRSEPRDLARFFDEEVWVATTERPEVGAALLRRIATDQIVGIDRGRLLTGATAGKGAARRLGRLIAEGRVAELLDIWGTGDKLNLRASALVTLSVDSSGLRRDRSAWGETRGGKNTAASRPLLPAHELIVYEIVRRTSEWVAQSERRQGGAANQRAQLPPLVLLDACIVHGGSFGIVLSVMAVEPRSVMRWVREIVNDTPHVRSTQTIQVAYRHSSRADRERFADEHPEYKGLIEQLSGPATPERQNNQRTAMRPTTRRRQR